MNFIYQTLNSYLNKKEFYRTYLTFRALSEIEMEMAMAALQGEAAEEAEADQVCFFFEF